MRLSARLCIALLAAFTVLDIAILALTGTDSGHRDPFAVDPGPTHVAGPARPVADESHAAVRTAAPWGEQPQREQPQREQPQGGGSAVTLPSVPWPPMTAARAGAPPAKPAHPAAAPRLAPGRHPVTHAVKPGAKHAARPAAKPARKATAQHAARPAVHRTAVPARNAAAVRVPPRRTPGPTSFSHYLRSLTGTDSDLWRMYRLGQWDATRHLAGARHLVLLDVGGQVPGGVHLSTTPRFVSYWRLDRAVEAYVAGYHDRQKANAPVTIAIGTNNDLLTTQTTGKIWAWNVVNPVYRYARRFPNLTIAGASDIEPGFAASVWRSRVWVVGFLQATTLPLIFNGSADGCSWTRPYSRCGHGWTAQDLAFVAGAWTSRITVLPQIYNTRMVGQWLQIAITALRDGGRRLRFWGPLTENGACGRDPYCPTMPGVAAWSSLWGALHRYGFLAPGEMPTRTDLDVR